MNTDLDELFTKAKELLKGEMTTLSYETWINPLTLNTIDGNNIILISNDSFKANLTQSRYSELLANAFSIILQKKCIVTILLDTDVAPSVVVETSTNVNNYNTSLNPKFSFSNFVVGDKNRFAHAAALAVAESPATAYNPLFIYGGVGLGKTHLMHAIGNEILRSNKNSRVLYTTCEKFLNAYINALQEQKIEEFRQRFRTIDVLLIDDIQFISKKESLQEEVLNTFNELKDSEKQIILSSDKLPRDIPLLEARLKSRFESGLFADVAMVDYETRLAILRKKRDENNVIIDDDILANIAAKIDSNIRELDGVFSKVVAQSTLIHAPITMEISEKAINDVILQKQSIISVSYIQEMVCKYFDVTTNELLSAHRSNDIAFPRQIGMYLSRILTNESFPNIGTAFGGRDHSTVMHAFKKIEKEMKENETTKLLVESVKKIILNKES